MRPIELEAGGCGGASVIEDRRRHRRTRIMQKCDITVDGHLQRATVVDLSAHGARLFTRGRRCQGEIIGLYVEANGITRPLPLRLTWDRYQDGAFEAGGTFTDLTPLEQEQLRCYLGSESVSGSRQRNAVL